MEVFAIFQRNGNMFFTSYRDPNLDKTLNVYDEAGNYFRSFAVDEREMTKYIIGTISAFRCAANSFNERRTCR